VWVITGIGPEKGNRVFYVQPVALLSK
jgi:hypothetical protein